MSDRKTANEELKLASASLGVELDETRLGRINHFLDLLVDYSRHTNLISCADLENRLPEHVLDSLSLVPLIESRIELPERGLVGLIDIGSGGGFPAIILLLVLDKVRATLVDSVGKKCQFLQEAISSLGLSDRAQVVNGRAEELAHDGYWYRSRYNIATARAVGSMAVVGELALAFLVPGGYLFLQKSARQVEDELEGASEIFYRMNANLDDVIPLDALLDDDVPLSSSLLDREHVVVLVRKRGETSAKFPRKWAQIKRGE